MSSIERRQEQQQTYWCDECDMSIHLLITSIPSGDYSPICPHCQSHNLELMDGDDPAITTQTILTDTTSITSFFLLDSLFLTLFNDDINSSSSSSSSLNDVFDTILPTIKITEASLLEGELEDVCAVCKEEFVIEVDDAKILPCNHLFHPHCILPWLTSNHTSCPLCRFHLLLPTTTDDDDDDDDCSFPDVGTLSSFLPSHF